LTLEQHDEGNETTDESMDSPVIKALRKQIAELTKERSNAPTREIIEAEVRSQLARESAISEQLIALGHPAGLSEFLKGKLGDVDVTRESVASALQGIGYQVEVAGAPEEGEAEASPSNDLANVSNLSASVRSATTGDSRIDGVSKVNMVNTQAELVELMRKEGLLAEN
jgi:hypothetical protein